LEYFETHNQASKDLRTIYFIGIDVSKAKLDYTFCKEGDFIKHSTIDNSPKALRLWFQQVKSEYKAGGQNTIFCIEHTGPYGDVVSRTLDKLSVRVWLESGIQIKRSLGLQRGKSDKIDSRRIAEYAFHFQNKFRQWQKPSRSIEKLRHLLNLRKTVKNQLRHLMMSKGESIPAHNNSLEKEIGRLCQGFIVPLNAGLDKVDLEIKSLIRNDSELNHLFQIVTSVSYVGDIVAEELLLSTNGFKNFTSAKKFACYCGIAPFEHSSGSSIHKKPRVSKIANKRIKSILHMPALRSISKDAEFRPYYEKKVAEGHAGLSVLKLSVRRKLLCSACRLANLDKLIHGRFYTYSRISILNQ
jgi:transposase